MNTFVRKYDAVEQTIVIVIKQLRGLRILRPRWSAYCLKLCLTIADHEQSGPIGASEKEICVAVLIDVSGGSACPMTVDIQTDFCVYISKRPVALIAVQVRRFAVVDDQQINVTPVIEIGGNHLNCVSQLIQLCCCCGLGEFAISINAQQQVLGEIAVLWIDVSNARRWGDIGKTRDEL